MGEVPQGGGGGLAHVWSVQNSRKGIREVGEAFAGVFLETRFEITRAVSMLRSLLKIELDACGRAIREGQVDARLLVNRMPVRPMVRSWQRLFTPAM